MDHPGNVQVVGRKEQKEWLLLLLFNPAFRFGDPTVRQILVAESSRVTAGVESDSADPVVNG